jgi:adenine deaminase
MPKREPHPNRFAAFLQARGIDRREAIRNGTFVALTREWIAERRIAIKMKQVAGVAARVQASTPKPMTAEAIKAQFATLKPGSVEASTFYKIHRTTLLR